MLHFLDENCREWLTRPEEESLTMRLPNECISNQWSAVVHARPRVPCEKAVKIDLCVVECDRIPQNNLVDMAFVFDQSGTQNVVLGTHCAKNSKQETLIQIAFVMQDHLHHV